MKWIEYAQSDIGNFDRLDYAQPRTIGSVPFSARCAWTSHRRVALASLQTLAWSKTRRNKLNPAMQTIEWGGLARHERRWATALAPILGDVDRIVGGPRQSEIVE